MTLKSILLMGLIAGLSCAQLADPKKAEVLLPTTSDWKASLILANDVGVWTVKQMNLIDRFGCPEVVGLDDKGRCIVLVSYSGKWTPLQTVEDGQWLGAIAHEDFDPRYPGAELYVGGKLGNLYQIYAHPEGGFDTRIIARFPGLELHTLALADLRPEQAGPEMLAFTVAGEIFEVYRNGPTTISGFHTRAIGKLPGRVRELLVLTGEAAEGVQLLAVLRAGQVSLINYRSGVLSHRPILQEPMGFGRIARATRIKDREVVYVTRDDGVILRLEEQASGPWKRETIYAGPQGPRGITAGRFHEDPEVESVAVFGYSKKVQMLTRKGEGPWSVETIFEDVDMGHWLSTAELDGRNGTDELLCSGYSGRIVLLSKPEGYGLKGVANDPDAAPKSKPTAKARPLRIGVEARPDSPQKLSPLSYRGGFETKTMLFETLVQRDAEGRIAPGLAASWSIEDDGKAFVLQLRKGAHWHDGKAVTAEHVVQHFRRWVGHPEHSWLGASNHIVSVRALSEESVRIELDQPYALVPDLCAINPCAIQGPGSFDRYGEFQTPIGSGPWKFVNHRSSDHVMTYERVLGGERIELVGFSGDSSEPIDALLQGELDVVLTGWNKRSLMDSLDRVRAAGRHKVLAGPGSSVVYVSFRMQGPTADKGVRRHLASLLSRQELVDRALMGYGTPCLTWAAPSVLAWPQVQESAPAPVQVLPPLKAPLRLLASDEWAPIAHVLLDQWKRGGIAVELVAKEDGVRALKEGAFDLRLEQTWGVPYDPSISLQSRLTPPAPSPNAADLRFFGIPDALTQLARSAAATTDEEKLTAIYSRIQNYMHSEAVILPLLVPKRLVILRSDLPDLALDHDLYRFDPTPLLRAESTPAK
jgi:ABC-type transport system substrate-binding protein